MSFMKDLPDLFIYYNLIEPGNNALLIDASGKQNHVFVNLNSSLAMYRPVWNSNYFYFLFNPYSFIEIP